MDVGYGVYAFTPSVGNFYDTTQADVQVVCNSGAIAYYISAFTEGGGNKFEQVSAGDLVTVSLIEDGTNTTATVHDITAGLTDTSTGASAFDTAENTGAYNYVAPGTIPTFGKVKFSQSQVNGTSLGNAAGVTALKMKPATLIQMTPTGFNATGRKFALKFRHAMS
jgi:hypothetical protein